RALRSVRFAAAMTTMKIASLIVAFVCGSAVTLVTLALAAYWWPQFCFPFVVATTLFYIVCRCVGTNPIRIGFVACSPGLFIPVIAWWLVRLSWEPVVEAKEAGGLYTIMSMGDPHSLSTIALFLVFPTALVLVSGLFAGAVAGFVMRRQMKMRISQISG
ncbi:MAG: hypothetical protein NTV49_01530, partial [Kiritimatiellaeota bacterium]|nr:hypothetical protein [Kiritimatiellota bacterium]